MSKSLIEILILALSIITIGCFNNSKSSNHLNIPDSKENYNECLIFYDLISEGYDLDSVIKFTYHLETSRMDARSEYCYSIKDNQNKFIGNKSIIWKRKGNIDIVAGVLECCCGLPVGIAPNLSEDNFYLTFYYLTFLKERNAKYKNPKIDNLINLGSIIKRSINNKKISLMKSRSIIIFDTTRHKDNIEFIKYFNTKHQSETIRIQ